MGQPREGPGTGSRRGRFASMRRPEDASINLAGSDLAASDLAAGQELAEALARRMRVRDCGDVEADNDPAVRYVLRLHLSPRRRPFTVTAYRDGSVDVAKLSTASSRNPYGPPKVLRRSRFRFDGQPTTGEVVDELAEVFDRMQWWN